MILMTNIKSLEFVLRGLDSLIETKEHHIGQKHSHVLTHEDTGTYKGKKITFKDPSRRQAGKTFWQKVKANPYKWLKDHPDANPAIVRTVKQIAAKQRRARTSEDTATYKGKKITFKDPSRRQAGKTAWADIKAHPQAWLNKHDSSHPWYSLVVQIRDKKRRQG